MRLQDSTFQSQRSCGRFFIFLAALSLGLACIHLFKGRWALAWKLVPGALFFGGIGWWGLSASATDEGPDEGDGGGRAGADNPLPIVPNPVQCLMAAKELPASEEMCLLAKD